MHSPSTQQSFGPVDALRVASLYGEDIAEVEVIETHISYLFITGRYVYKLKKSVQFGFLDYSTLENRRAACEAAGRVHLEICPDRGDGRHRVLVRRSGLPGAGP